MLFRYIASGMEMGVVVHQAEQNQNWLPKINYEVPWITFVYTASYQYKYVGTCENNNSQEYRAVSRCLQSCILIMRCHNALKEVAELQQMESLHLRHGYLLYVIWRSQFGRLLLNCKGCGVRSSGKNDGAFEGDIFSFFRRGMHCENGLVQLMLLYYIIYKVLHSGEGPIHGRYSLGYWMGYYISNDCCNKGVHLNRHQWYTKNRTGDALVVLAYIQKDWEKEFSSTSLSRQMVSGVLAGDAPMYYVVSPKDVVIAKPSDAEDLISLASSTRESGGSIGCG
ncbi:hypothetical protein C5167_006100 [Papaver somniferum]|uniref:Uncharacterized protein n=1 Tax=Papaver somniferum TaxID=3469 RepID=A0A4Y7JCC5_PAPSO|nr:hypothetical protein C5167_006100 [Papaver somniferum]